ncbi:MAG: glycoside hydrolase family 3 C-terminal domain-containing protein [Bacteroidetes bacterium]|nr:glycoside hydrolase family 3 C-terminal domain-containing protein [Bacteroidota bacterium]
MSRKYNILLFSVLNFVLNSSILYSQIYLDSTATVEARTEDLLQRLSLSQKLQYIGGYNDFYIRAVTNPAIPMIKMSDGPVGVRTWGQTTAYPAGICSASTWDTALINGLGVSLGRDARARGVHILLAPGVNMHRAPMCGRNFEYFGEDPFLAGEITAAYIRGVQSERVIATVKHFAANNQEWDRNIVSSNMEERTLQEIYLPAFRAAVVNGKAGAIMSAYNLLNGSYCSQNKHLLTEILKQDWNFDGFVMSDWGATHDGLKAALAGLDLEMPSGVHMNSAILLPAINNGTLNPSVIDDKVRRILSTLFRFGFFDHPQLDPSIPLDNPASAAVSLNIARAGIVLLKNENNILPFDKNNMTKIAVIGPNGNSYVAGGGSSYTDPFHSVSVLSAIESIAGPGITVTFDKGFTDDDTVFQTSQFYIGSGSGQSGLHAEYFNNQNLSGTAYYISTDNKVNFNWGAGSPSIAGFPADHFSIRWTGVIRPQSTGNYEFILRCDDGGRLYLDNQLIINQWHDQSATTYRTTMVFVGGTEHSIKIEYYENGGDAEIRAGWHLLDFTNSLAIQHAAEADAAIVCAGFNSDLESEGFDRTFELPALQDSLINAISSVNPRTIVVLNAGGNVATSNWLSHVKGLLHAWYPGQEGGTAVAEIIFGITNPSGKLPVSFEKRWEDNPTFNSYYDENHDQNVYYSEGLLMGYRYYDTENVEPLFPFGYGLSYTTFEYGNLSITPDTTGNPNEITVSFDVKNTGSRDGAEVAQLYIHQPVSKLMRPFKELKGFSKVSLLAGETKNVSITLDSSSFSYYKTYTKAWGLDYTDFVIMVGASSRDIRLTGYVELTSPDITKPQVTALTPTDSTSNLSSHVDFVMNFNKPVNFNQDKMIIIREYATDKVKEIINAGNIGGSGTSTISFFNNYSLSLNTKYYVVVDSAAFLDLYENAFAGISDKDTWSFTITVSGMGSINGNAPLLNVYPNPAKNVLMVEYRLPSKYQPSLQIVDIFGRVMVTMNLSSNLAGTKEFECSALKSGIYFVKITSEKGILTSKIVKE